MKYGDLPFRRSLGRCRTRPALEDAIVDELREALACGDAALLADAHVVGVVGAVRVLSECIPTVRGEQRVPVVGIALLADLHRNAEALRGLAVGDELLGVGDSLVEGRRAAGRQALVGEERDVLQCPWDAVHVAVCGDAGDGSLGELRRVGAQVDREGAILDEQADLVVRPFEDVRHIPGLIGLEERVLQLAWSVEVLDFAGDPVVGGPGLAERLDRLGGVGRVISPHEQLAEPAATDAAGLLAAGWDAATDVAGWGAAANSGSLFPPPPVQAARTRTRPARATPSTCAAFAPPPRCRTVTEVTSWVGAPSRLRRRMVVSGP